MSYVINKTTGVQLIVLEDGTLDTSTSLGLVGRNYTGYGEIQNENFVYLLENFANDAAPARPLEGQTWFNTVLKTLNVYNGSDWGPVGSAVISSTPPPGSEGTFWLDLDTKQLYVFIEGVWKLVGPEAVQGFGETGTKARDLFDSDGIKRPVIVIIIDDQVMAIIARTAFTIAESNFIPGFFNLFPGVNFHSSFKVYGNLEGNAASATKLEIPRLINTVPFDGQADITITATTNRTLIRGNYLTGSNFDGATATTWAVDASPNNVIGKVVARDSAGDFEAGTITANLIGNVTGNVTANIGTSTFFRVEAQEFVGASLTGNANTATKLKTAREINGVLFDGSTNVTVPSAAGTLTGDTLAANVVNLGPLNAFTVADAGITVGSEMHLFNNLGSQPTLRSIVNNLGLVLETADSTQNGNYTGIKILSTASAVSAGNTANRPAVVPFENNATDLGIGSRKWTTVYANTFSGVATSAQYADLAENYLADTEYSAGTVLEFGGEFEVTVAEDETRRVAGVVTTNPAYLMNSECKGEFVTAIALQGRVPCKVRGNIRKGDMLVSGGNGFARPTQDPKIGTIIGKALEDFNGISGIIEVAVGRL